MKTLILKASLLLFLPLVTFSQETTSYVEVMRSVLSTEKKAAVAEVMALNEADAKAFWPLYNEFQESLYKTNSKKFDLIMEFADNFEQMSEEKAPELLERFFSIKQEELTLRQSYVAKFQKAIGSLNTVKYFQTENKIAVMVDYQLAASIPILNN